MRKLASPCGLLLLPVIGVRVIRLGDGVCDCCKDYQHGRFQEPPLSVAVSPLARQNTALASQIRVRCVDSNDHTQGAELELGASKPAVGGWTKRGAQNEKCWVPDFSKTRSPGKPCRRGIQARSD